jgi:hypothetical protein
MEKNDHFRRDMQRYIAASTIGPSTLRNPRASGVSETAQKYVAVVDLSAFSAQNEDDYLAALNAQTKLLQTAFPLGARNWSAARKALNIFLRDICYNRFLCERHRLAASGEWMEIPLDKLVATALKRKASQGKLPPWPGLNQLTAEISKSGFCAKARSHRRHLSSTS